MKRIALLLAVLLALPAASYGDQFAKVGTFGGQFLKIGVSARAAKRTTSSTTHSG